MSPDRKLFEHQKASDHRRYGHLKTVFRICGPVIVFGALFLIVAEVLEFRSKNRFDANSYPLADFLMRELVCVLIFSVAVRFWVLSLRKE